MNQEALPPDFTAYGYQSIKLLSSAKSSVNVWLGEIPGKKENSPKVVIKQFCFATGSSSWSKYQSCHQELQLLQSLDHPGIPKFISSFETKNSFCFVREYLPGKPLASYQDLTVENIIKIALKSLEILVYLQQQIPSIFHLNITPEHILIDEQFNVYLCGLSLMRNNSNRLDPQLLKLNNAQFIAPEQWQAPTLASDLYGLGSTLEEAVLRQLSLRLIPQQSLTLEQTKTNKEKSSATKDSLNAFELEKLALPPSNLEDSEIDSNFQTWLTTMTESEEFNRYVDAAAALKELKASFWDEIAAPEPNERTKSLNYKSLILSSVLLFILGIFLRIGLGLSQQAGKINFTNMAIVLMGMVVIYLAQMAATTFVTQKQTEKKQGIILAVTIPLAIITITDIIFGRGEAVAMSVATVFSQILSLVTTLLKLHYLSSKVKLGLGLASFCAVAMGIILGSSLAARLGIRLFVL